MEPLKERVRAALAAAAENGHTFEDWTPANIAFDMVSFDSALESEDVDDVAAVVAELVAEQQAAGPKPRPMRQVKMTRLLHGTTSYQFVEIDEDGFSEVILRGQRDGVLSSDEVEAWLTHGTTPGACTCAALPEPPDDSCPVHGGKPA